MIWGTDRSKFDKPPQVLCERKDVCVSRLIVEHKGQPQIVSRDPSRITIK